MKIRVFPDNLASGLWGESGAEVLPHSVGVTDPGLLIALKYWVYIWEFWEFVIDYGKFTRAAVESFNEDGQQLVDELNKKYGNVHEFVYVPTPYGGDNDAE